MCKNVKPELLKRQIGIFLLFFSLIFSVEACQKENDPVKPELSISSERLNFDEKEQSKTIQISSNLEWNIESTEDWCYALMNKGKAGTTSVQIKVNENLEEESRTSIIKVSSGDEHKEIEISQEEGKLLIIEKSNIDALPEGDDIEIHFGTTTDFEVLIDVDWITKSVTKSIKDSSIMLSVKENRLFTPRVGTITFTYGDSTKVVYVNQKNIDVSIPADISGVESKAIDLVSKMIVGLNIGNSLDVPGGETLWGNPAISKELIDGVKAAGFNAVRIPCAWDNYIEDRNTHKIKDTWLARVKEVVDYCVENKMYVIINTHWDGGWLEEHPVYSKQEEINEKLYAIWTQISLTFRDYNEYLIFAGTNEVRQNWEPTTENIDVQESFCQTFVNAVRATGGKNAYRNLIVQTYNTNIDFGIQYHSMPLDNVEERLITEVHYYDPWDFCGQEDGDYKTQWGAEAGYTDISTWAQEEHLKNQFNKLHTKYISKNIPVIIGECGALYRADLTGETLDLHRASRNYFLKTLTRTAKDFGIVPFIWDNGWTGNNGFGLFNRSTGEEEFSDAIDAIMEGAQ